MKLCHARLALLVGSLLLLASLAHAIEPVALDEVRQQIEAQGQEWIAAPTTVSKMPLEQFESMLGLDVPDGYDEIPRVDLSKRLGKLDDLPARWDWRDHEGTTSAKYQGNCGSCWAFACVGALEGCARIQDGVEYDLSEQQLISCNWYGYGCNGGYFEGCYEVFRTLGAVGEGCMPYMASDNIPCSMNACEIEVMASEMIRIENSVPSIQAAVYEYGPIVCAMSVFSDFRYYSGGCYENPGGGPLNHAIVIAGWDDELCGGVWICKNSWSEGWGDNGWFMIRYGHASMGSDATVIVPTPGRVVQIGTIPFETTTDGSSAYDVAATLRSRANTPINPDSAFLCYRVNEGEWSVASMKSSGSGNTWHGRIPSQPMSATVDYYFDVRDIEGRVGRAPWDAPADCYSFDVARVWEKFEESTDGWRLDSSGSSAQTGAWELVAPVGTDAQPDGDHSLFGTKCWVTGQHLPEESTGYSDIDGGRTTLMSPAYDLGATRTAIVKYWRWFSNDQGAWPSTDPWIVQARNDRGPWIDLENTIESSNAWVRIERDLIEILGSGLGLVEFRFIACDEEPASCVEAAIDDFSILAEERQPIGLVSPSVGRVGFAEIHPNPTQSGATISFTLAKPSWAELTIYTADGRLVRSLVDGVLAHGPHTIAWDGLDAIGSPASSGIYFARLTAGKTELSRKIVVRR